MMARFIFELPDELRDKLEGHRVAWGRRSLSDALQHLITTKADKPLSPREVERTMREIRERVQPETERKVRQAGVNTRGDTSRPVVSRLKGQWKAP
jgi:hypothetical protein